MPVEHSSLSSFFADKCRSIFPPHPEPASYARKFSGKYAHRTIKGGIGHNLPQEAPQEFAKAIIEGGGY